jgi:hypothetical protein
MSTQKIPNIERCKSFLLDINVNPASTIEYEINNEIYTITLDWIIETYMNTSEATQELFINSLLKMQTAPELKAYFEQMGQLILMSSLSQKDTNITSDDLIQ